MYAAAGVHAAGAGVHAAGAGVRGSGAPDAAASARGRGGHGAVPRNLGVPGVDGEGEVRGRQDEGVHDDVRRVRGPRADRVDAAAGGTAQRRPSSPK